MFTKTNFRENVKVGLSPSKQIVLFAPMLFISS